MDDLCVHSETWEEHKVHLRAVLQKLRDLGIVPNMSKCHFGKSKVTYLGNIVSEKGRQPDPLKTAALASMPMPACPAEVRRFLGLANYFSDFIPR